MWLTICRCKKKKCWLMNSHSVSPPLLVCVSSKRGSVVTGGVFKRNGLRLVPLNNGSLGAGKRGPGTNVAIMLMVRITGDSHYWPELGLLCRADHPAAAASIREAWHFGHQGWLGWWAAGGRQDKGICPLLITIQRLSAGPPHPSAPLPPSLAASVVDWYLWTVFFFTTQV